MSAAPAQMAEVVTSARQFWRACREAELALCLGLRSEAVEAIERLRDLTEIGPMPIRQRAAASLPPFLSALTALVETTP